jgi:hypothetical protein
MGCYRRSQKCNCSYFDWAKAVVDGLPRVSEDLLAKFDAAYAARPHLTDSAQE